MTLNQEFETNPVLFMKTHPLDSGDLHPSPPLPRKRHGEDQIFSPNITKHYFEKPSKNTSGGTGIINIQWGSDLSLFKFVSQGEGNCVQLQKNNDDIGNSVEIYYLPWSIQNVTSMTLPENADGKYFMTAGLSGCSVFVRGNAVNPTIYHAGCENKSKYETTELWKACIRKLGENHPTPKFYGIDKYDHKKTRAGGLRKDTSASENAYNTLYGNFTKLTKKSSAGCVFGVKDERTNKWDFYLQERCMYEILILRTGVSYTYWDAVSLRRFYPTGAKHVQLLNRSGFA